MARFEISVHHDVAVGDVGSNLFEVVENGSLFRRRFRYRLNDVFKY